MKQKIKEWFIDGVLKAIVTGKENLRFTLARKEIARRFKMAENQETRKWWQSKTIIVNVLTIIAGGLAYLSSPDAKLDAQTAGAIGSALGMVNVILRMVTDKPLGK